VLVITRFRVTDEAAGEFRPRLEAALELLGAQRGYVDGAVGRNVDDPSLWVLQTRWVGPGAYRRALSAYDVKLNAWALLGQAIEEPSAYEILRPGTATNDPQPRGDP
jgi:quinol monooxygenase YgiN